MSTSHCHSASLCYGSLRNLFVCSCPVNLPAHREHSPHSLQTASGHSLLNNRCCSANHCKHGAGFVCADTGDCSWWWGRNCGGQIQMSALQRQTLYRFTSVVFTCGRHTHTHTLATWSFSPQSVITVYRRGLPYGGANSVMLWGTAERYWRGKTEGLFAIPVPVPFCAP